MGKDKADMNALSSKLKESFQNSNLNLNNEEDVKLSSGCPNGCKTDCTTGCLEGCIPGGK